MVTECETGVDRIKPASKSVILDWIINAAKLVQTKPNSVRKSFEVGGIVPSHDVRCDQVCSEIQGIMKDVFGDVHMGYVSDNLTAGSSNEAEVDPFASDSDADNSESDYRDVTSKRKNLDLIKCLGGFVFFCFVFCGFVLLYYTVNNNPLHVM